MTADHTRPSGLAARTQSIFAYLTAAALAPYLMIKMVWVVGALSGLLPVGHGFGLTGWVVLNMVTVILAAAGTALGLALARPWGTRIPAVPLLVGAWIGSGLLVPMLPYLLVSSLLGGGDGADDGPGPMLPAWEGVLISVSFAGFAVGLAVALPLYLRQRWPAAFHGRTGHSPGTLGPSGRIRTLGSIGVVLAAACGLLQLYWASGGTLGLHRPELRDLNWRLLTINAAVWATVGAAGVWTLTRGRPANLPLVAPVAMTWVVSGFLFAWNCWKLPLMAYVAARPDRADVWPESVPVAAAVAAAGVAAGAAMLAALVSIHAHRVRSLGKSRETVAGPAASARR